MKSWLTLFCFFISFSLTAAEIKIALLAPEGSTWMTIMHEWDQELRQKTAGQVGFRFYSGGAMGDEKDVIRKMKIGQLHAAGLTGNGLGMILPEIRVMELPFLYKDYEQVRSVRTKLSNRFKSGFSKKGFKLLGWAENGFVYIFSQKPISKMSDLKTQKMWAWIGDPLVGTMYDVFDITPVPLAVPDVLPSLQTKLVEAAYAPPLAATAMQWFTVTSYITDLPLAFATGALLITQKSWAGFTPAQQQLLLKTGEKYSSRLNEAILKDNEKTLEILLKSGLQKIAMPDNEIKAIRTQSLEVHQRLQGKLYSEALLTEVNKILK